MSEQKQPAEVGPAELVLGPLPEPDLQTDPCSAAGKQTDYYTAGTVRRLLAAERERCAKLCDTAPERYDITGGPAALASALAGDIRA